MQSLAKIASQVSKGQFAKATTVVVNGGGTDFPPTNPKPEGQAVVTQPISKCKRVKTVRALKFKQNLV